MGGGEARIPLRDKGALGCSDDPPVYSRVAMTLFRRFLRFNDGCRPFIEGIPMFRLSMCALLILSFNSVASAQTSSAPPSADLPAPAASEPAVVPEIDVRAMVVEKPSLQPVLRAIAYSNLSRANAEIEIDYSASGDVTAVRLVKASTVDAIDRAIVAWAAKLKLKPGVAGTGRVPFELTSR